jgi:HlyD family secretion protein
LVGLNNADNSGSIANAGHITHAGSADQKGATSGEPANNTPATSTPVTKPESKPETKPETTPINKPSRHITLLLMVAAVVAVILYFSRNLILGTPVTGYAVIMGPLQQTVVASGRVVWPQRVDIAAETVGRVSSIPVVEGQQVALGQLLIQLEDNAERANLVLAMAAVAQAQATIRQQQEVALPAAQEGFIQASADATQLRNQLLRIRQLTAQDYVTAADLETATRNLAIADSKLNAAKLQVETNQVTGSAAMLTRSTLAQAQASLKLAKVKLQQAAIRAAAAGTLISRGVEPGDIVQPGKILMVLAAQGETQLQVQIDEKNLAKLALGQMALASADAYAEQRFTAEVMYINPGIDPTRGSVEIKLRVPQPPDYLRQDMTVSVDIETARSEQALVIPTAALRDPSGANPWVLVVRDKHTQHQNVTVGLRGDNYLEIRQGVSAGEAVILPTEGLIKAEQRVRVTLAEPIPKIIADAEEQ